MPEKKIYNLNNCHQLMLDPFRNDPQQCYKKKLILKTSVLRVRTSCSKAFISCLTNVAHVFEHIIQGNFTK